MLKENKIKKDIDSVINLIILAILMMIVCIFAFVAGYMVGERGILNQKSLLYSGKDLLLPSFQDPIQTEEKYTTLVMRELNEKGGLDTTYKEVKIIVGKLGDGVAGRYSDSTPNTIRVINGSNRDVIGHELCHLILHNYGVLNMVANENICYTIEANYAYMGEVKRRDLDG